MPRKENFSLLDTEARPVYSTIGVLMSAQGTDQRANVKPILGAYYNTLEQDSGLYIPLPDGSFDYFDIEIQDLVAQGDSRLVRFDSDGVNYLMRPLYEEDGEWLSKYKIPLPSAALEKMITLQSHDALEEFTGADLGEQLPIFEGLYAYYIPGNNFIISLIYISSVGVFRRSRASWEKEDISLDIYEGMLTVEINPESASEFLKIFDKSDGNISVEEVKKVSVEYK